MTINRIVEFASTLPEPQPKKKGGHRLLIGAAVAAPGVPLIRASARFTASTLRPGVAGALRDVAPKLANRIHNPGKQIFDYIEGAQQALNKGPFGKFTGEILRNPKTSAAKLLVPNQKARSHYSSFRAGHKEAFTSMVEEVGGVYQGKVSASKGNLQRAANNRKLGSYTDEIGHALTDFDTLIQKKGYNEKEALRHITSNPKHADLMRKLIPKTSFAPQYARGTAILGAPPVLAGAVVASTRKRK